MSQCTRKVLCKLLKQIWKNSLENNTKSKPWTSSLLSVVYSSILYVGQNLQVNGLYNGLFVKRAIDDFNEHLIPNLGEIKWKMVAYIRSSSAS